MVEFVNHIRDLLQVKLETSAEFRTLNQFAKKAGVKQAALHNLMNPNKESNPTAETIEKLSKALEYSDVRFFLADAYQAYEQKNDASEREKIERVGSSVIDLLPNL